jgi:hypothetical protein
MKGKVSETFVRTSLKIISMSQLLRISQVQNTQTAIEVVSYRAEICLIEFCEDIASRSTRKAVTLYNIL